MAGVLAIIVGAQEVGAPAHPFCGERLNRMLRNAEQFGDFSLGEAFDFSEKNHFAAALREGIDGIGQKRQFLTAADLFNQALITQQDGEGGIFRHGHDLRILLLAQKIAHRIARDGKEQAFRIPDRALLLRFQQTKVGFLDKVIHFSLRRK